MDTKFLLFYQHLYLKVMACSDATLHLPPCRHVSVFL